MTVLLSIVPKLAKVYLIELKSGGIVRVSANSYCGTDYGTFAFYREESDQVNKAYNKGCPPAPVYETPRKSIIAISEEGMSEICTITVTEQKGTKTKGKVKTEQTAVIVKKAKKTAQD
jgi:hypothetical protein